MSSSEHKSSMPEITILGAGIAGLTLGQRLRKRGISALILERASSPSYYTYGLTLRQWAYQPLAEILDEPVSSFRTLVAMNNHHRNDSSHFSNSPFPSNSCESFRAHRGRLEAILRKGLNIKYQHDLASIEKTERQEIILKFKNDVPSITLDAQTNLIVGADGVHSELRRLVSPSFKTTTLPYVVFNGRRNISKEEFQEFYAPEMNKATRAQIIVPFRSHPYFVSQSINILLQIHVNDYTLDGNHVNISYTFSRLTYPASGIPGSDPLDMTNRSKDEATKIPDAFFEELKLLKEAGVSNPYLHAFDPVRVQEDRLLNWLMRSGLMRLDELEKSVKWNPPQYSKPSNPDEEHNSESCFPENGKQAGTFLLIGDAVHPTPILGGEGANHAIRDGLELAEYISRPGLKNADGFYKQKRRGDGSGEGKSRWDTWKDDLDLSEQVIREMHGVAGC